MTEREALDAEMRVALAQLSICSHVPAAPWQPTGRSRSSDEPLGGNQPPGDLGEAKFARMYGPPFHEATPNHPGCTTDEGRRRVVSAAWEELKHIRGQDERPVVVEDEDWWAKVNAEIVKYGEGFSVKEVAIRFRCAERIVINARLAAGREPVLGKLPESEGGRRRGAAGKFEEVNAAARQARVRELDEKGLKLTQIAMILGVSKTTVERDLGKRAA